MQSELSPLQIILPVYIVPAKTSAIVYYIWESVMAKPGLQFRQFEE